jgi:hypothetical protein
MKSYILRAGSMFTLVHEGPTQTLVSPSKTFIDMPFESNQLVEVDTVTHILHFKIGNTHYYANNSNISVIH